MDQFSPPVLRLASALLTSLCLHVPSATAMPSPWRASGPLDATRAPSARPAPKTPTLVAALALDGSAVGVETRDGERRRPPEERHVWLEADGASANARELLARIADADAHGLDPARYDLKGLRSALAATFDPRSPLAPAVFDASARAALASRFDRAFAQLATDLGRGLVDARSVQPNHFRDVPEPDIERLRARLARGELSVADAFDSVAPTDERYLRLVETTRKLLAARAKGATHTRLDTADTLRAGQRHAEVEPLVHRLVELGDLPPDTAPSPLFDDALTLAVKVFQRRHGIDSDGVVGARTRAALNRSIDDELDDLALSLERWRWMPRELGERHVFVNLPDYRLTLHDGARRLLDMPIVIGTSEHETPSFSRDMIYLEFSPTWTVPSSIARNELLPIERRQPGYLKSRRFDFLEEVNGQLRKVSHDTVTREDLQRKPFPYRLRQRGGPGNALGRMKFIMPNPYSVYLHDTPAQRHFALHDRAYSHGCIRLSDPDRLAELLLRDDGRESAEIESLIAGRTTRRASLRTPVPTHLAYFTTWVDERGDVRHRTDVYGNDPALRAALRANGTLPSARLGTASPPG